MKKLLKEVANSDDEKSAANHSKNYIKDSYLEETGLSREAFSWLYNWQWNETILREYQTKGITDKKVEKELNKFRPKEPVDLYRWIPRARFPEKYNNKLVSYGKDQEQVFDILSGEKDGGFVDYLPNFPIKRMLVDTTQIPHFLNHFANETIIYK